MAIVAGNARGSTTPPGHAQLSMIARAMQGMQHGVDDPSSAPVPQEGGSTAGGLDIQSLMAALKSGQMSAQSLMQILALLMGVGSNPTAGNMASIQNAGQGGPPGAPGGPAGGPIGAAMMGAGAGGQ
jgi:hypothetical protein